MFRETICACSLLALLASFSPNAHNQAAAQGKAAPQKDVADQDAPKPLDPNDPRLTFSFPIQPGGKPFRFKVELNKTGNIAGVSVFRDRDSKPFQTLTSCQNIDFTDPVTEFWTGYEIAMLINHADLNFDGFEDLELLQNYIPHLDKKLYCIYLWDNKTGRFIYSKELTDVGVNLVTHSENKTLTTREDWQGGPWEKSTYRWNSGKLELIEQDGLYGDWSTQTDKKCGFEFSCNRLINGEMVTTLEKPVCTPEEMDNLPPCPAAVTPPAPKAPAKIPILKSKD